GKISPGFLHSILRIGPCHETMSQAIEQVAKTSPRDDKWQSSLSKLPCRKAFQFFDQTGFRPLPSAFGHGLPPPSTAKMSTAGPSVASLKCSLDQGYLTVQFGISTA